MSNTRKAIRQEVARLLAGPQVLSNTTSADGASTGLTLIDYTYKSSLLQDGHFVGFPLYIASGMWVDLCHLVQAYDASVGQFTVDEAFKFAADGTGVTTDTSAKTLTDTRQNWVVDRYVGATLTCNSETLTVTSNTATVQTGTGGWSGDPGNAAAYTITYPVKAGVEYEIHPIIHPTLINEAIDRALRKMLYPSLALPSLLADADMETSGMSSWSDGAGATGAKDTTAANLFRGTQSLSVTADATGGDDEDAYTYQAVNCVEGDSYFLWGACRTSAAATECKLEAYDGTTGAAIGSETHDEVAWQTLGFEFIIPSGCKSLQIRLQTMTNSGVSYWDQVQLLRKGQRRYALPSWVTEEWQVGKTIYEYEGANLVGDGRMPDETGGREHAHIWTKKEQATVYIVPDPPFNNGAPVYVQCLRHYTALATDAATTDADLDWVAAKAKYECLRMLAAPLVPHEERDPFRQALQEAKAEAAAMDARFMPQVTGKLSFGQERLFNVRQV